MAAYALDGLFTAWDIYELYRTLNADCPDDLDVALAGGGLVAGLFLPGGGLGTAAKALVKSGRKASKTTKLYRAVSQAELDDIGLNGFRPGRNAMETKLFATSAEDASFWARDVLFPIDGEARTLVQVEVPNSLLDQLYQGAADGRAIVGVGLEMFEALNSSSIITILRSMPIP